MRIGNVIMMALFTSAVLPGCSPSTSYSRPFIPPASPALSWTALWVQGTQTGPIGFQSVGQSATLAASAAQPGGASPPYTFTSGSCVTLSNETTSGSTENVTVTAANTGSCSVTVTATGGSTSSIQVTVP